MRSLKRMLLVTTMALLSIAFVVPSFAAADEWSRENVEFKIGQDPVFTEGGYPLNSLTEVGLQGTIQFENAGIPGGVKCTVTGNTFLVGIYAIMGQNFTTAGCKGFGALAGCTIESVTKDHNEEFWFAYLGENSGATGTYITIKFKEGIFCLFTEEVYGGAHFIKPDNPDGMNYWELYGTVESKASGTATISGKYNLTPAGKYGIKRVGKVGLNGTLNWSNGSAGVECTQASAEQFLKLGGEGDVKAFGAYAPSCKTSGTYSSCTVSSIQMKNAPWKMTNETSKIKLSNASFSVNLTGGSCPTTRLDVAGTLYETPPAGQVNAISETSLSGTTTTTTAGGSSIGGTWTGQYNWSPAGVFGL